MEETVINENETQPMINQEPQQETSSVGFPGTPQKKKGWLGKFLIIFLGLAILGVIGFLVFKGIGGSAAPTATPSVESISGSTQGSSTEATPTPVPVDKSTISVKVENGTGIAGEAGYLQGILANLGYTKIEVGNADSQDNLATQVTFSADLSQQVIDEITKKLESVYQDVKTKTSATKTANDIVIITGLRKGATPKPTATNAPTASPAATLSN